MSPGLDVFFILRAAATSAAASARSGRSRWSGQVGFPGGHVEAGEEDRGLQGLVTRGEA